MREFILINITGQDKPGLTSSLTNILAQYEVTILDIESEEKGQNYVADESNIYFIKVYANEGANAADYTIDLTLNNQNDAETGTDAGDSITNPTEINTGSLEGYIDSTDP